MKREYSQNLFSPNSPPGLTLQVQVSPLDGRIRREINGIIDTGADFSTIPEKLAKELQLKTKGGRLVMGFTGKDIEYCETYLITLSLDNKSSFDLEVFSTAREHCLIGRDVLNQFVIHANGPKKYFRVTDECSYCIKKIE
jgi:hypothetical protein